MPNAALQSKPYLGIDLTSYMTVELRVWCCRYQCLRVCKDTLEPLHAEVHCDDAAMSLMISSMSTRVQACASPEGAGSGQSVPQLPEKVMMALVSTPAVFGGPPAASTRASTRPSSCVSASSPTLPTQIKATVAAYVLQKDQVANLEKWHPAQHVVTESLSGAIVTQKIVCHGPSHPKLPQPSPGKHTGRC